MSKTRLYGNNQGEKKNCGSSSWCFLNSPSLHLERPVRPLTTTSLP
ncbi:MAG: hypothetical protein F6K31_14005 [Symploca sp. SIO2G7]|nr:hypothetical protein [Symploca sp. SIO2G7]